jgi:hypothetical protein
MTLDRIGPVAPSDQSPRIGDHFLRLTGPLINLVTIALDATIAGVDDFASMIARCHGLLRIRGTRSSHIAFRRLGVRGGEILHDSGVDLRPGGGGAKR